MRLLNAFVMLPFITASPKDILVREPVWVTEAGLGRGSGIFNTDIVFVMIY